MYSLAFTDEALKALARMPTNMARLIRKKLDQLAVDPMRANNNVKALKGRPGYRLRIGDWRVIYRIQHERLVVHVIDIGVRGGIYD